MYSTHTPTFTDNNALSNNLYKILFLPAFSSSPGWLLVTRTRGAWWCHDRGHWRSGPRHLSPRSRVCAEEWHCKDIHSHIHSHPPMHTPKRKRNKRTGTKCSTHRTWRFRLLVLLLSNVVVGDGQEARHLLLRTVQLRRPSFLEQYWQKTFLDVFNTYSNISRQQCPV